MSITIDIDKQQRKALAETVARFKYPKYERKHPELKPMDHMHFSEINVHSAISFIDRVVHWKVLTPAKFLGSIPKGVGFDDLLIGYLAHRIIKQSTRLNGKTLSEEVLGKLNVCTKKNVLNFTTALNLMAPVSLRLHHTGKIKESEERNEAIARYVYSIYKEMPIEVTEEQSVKLSRIVSSIAIAAVGFTYEDYDPNKHHKEAFNVAFDLSQCAGMLIGIKKTRADEDYMNDLNDDLLDIEHDEVDDWSNKQFYVDLSNKLISLVRSGEFDIAFSSTGLARMLFDEAVKDIRCTPWHNLSCPLSKIDFQTFLSN